MRYVTLAKKIAENSNIKALICVRSSEDLNETIDTILDRETSEEDKLQMIENGQIRILQVEEVDEIIKRPTIINQDTFTSTTLCKVKEFSHVIFFQIHHKELINGVY